MTLPTLRPNGETVSEVGRLGHTHAAPKRMAAVRLALAMTAQGVETRPKHAAIDVLPALGREGAPTR